jgi:PAS domain S-box-containing protein
MKKPIEKTDKTGRESRKQAEAQAKWLSTASPEYSESIINTVREPLIILDQDLRVVTASRSFYEVFKVKAEETVGQFIYDLGNKQWNIPKLRELLETILPQKATFDNYEVEHDFAGIGRRIMLLNARQIEQVMGKERIILLAIEDITEQKRKDVELHRLNRTLKAQSRSSQAMMRADDESAYMNEVCGIIVKECGHAMVWIGFAENDENKSVRPVASAGFEEGYLETVKITWADKERGRGPTGTAIRLGKPSICRNMLTDPAFKPWREESTKHGYASSIVLPLMAEGKAFGAISIYSRDPDPFTEDEMQLLFELANDLAQGITAIRLRAALRESEQNANAILNAITESIWLMDSEGDILAANSIAAERMGMRISEIKGKNYFDLLPPHLANPLRMHAEKAFRSGESVRFEDEKAGIAFDNNIYPVRNEKGNITGLSIFSSDITERRETENGLEKAHEELEELAAALKRTARVKSEFLANMSHELRTPLNTINGFSEVLYDETFGPLNEKQKKYVHNVLTSGKHLLLLINQILDTAKVEAGKMNLTLSSLPMKSLLNEISLLVADMVGRKKLHMSLEIAEDLPNIEADELKVKEIMYNLLSNAVKFTPEGGKIGIRANKADSEIEIVVWDTGVGIALENMEKIFEGFFRVDTPFLRVTEGTGLGLPLSKKLVELHGGRLSVESKGLNQGISVRLTLPIISRREGGR